MGGLDGAPGIALNGSTVRRNTASLGGGIGNDGTATITSSTVSGNEARYHGGGMSNEGTLTLTDSTVSGNEARYDGGGIWNWDTLTLTDSTVSGNTASLGGGIWNYIDPDPDYAGTVTLDGASSVTGNVPDDCVGTPAC